MLRRVTLGQKLFGGFCATVLMSAIVGAVLWFTLAQLEHAKDRHSRAAAALTLVNRAGTAYAVGGRSILAFAATGTPRPTDEFEASWTPILPGLDQALALVPDRARTSPPASLTPAACCSAGTTPTLCRSSPA